MVLTFVNVDCRTPRSISPLDPASVRRLLSGPLQGTGRPLVPGAVVSRLRGAGSEASRLLTRPPSRWRHSKGASRGAEASPSPAANRGPLPGMPSSPRSYNLHCMLSDFRHRWGFYSQANSKNGASVSRPDLLSHQCQWDIPGAPANKTHGPWTILRGPSPEGGGGKGQGPPCYFYPRKEIPL